MIKILAYSDIHYHDFNNGLTVDDVEAVDNKFTDLIQDLNVDLYIFGGDRFISRNPLDRVKFIADRAISRRVALQGDAIGIYLVGNHDRSTKNDHSHHSMMHLGLYPNDLKGIYVISEISCRKFNIRGTTVNVYGIPAGHGVPNEPIQPRSNNTINICVFHDLLYNTVLQNGQQIAINKELYDYLDNPNLDLVLGGDNHAHQGIRFSNTRGWYIGAPMHHDWGDVGGKRGFLYIELDESGAVLTAQLIESGAPKFVKLDWHVSSIHDIAKLASEAGNLHNCIVKLYITTKRSVIGTFTASELEASLRAGWAARHVKIIFDFVSEDVAAPPQIVSDAELWIAYLASKGDNIKVNKDKLLETGLKYIND